ncbi:cytochrome c-type biogenesis protein [Ferrithrix thermotolerans DSM 19514]|uniref:Cytochrome c-type biogenesis protein n=1 Tax=Ferrithrix thermotolerans DSM 19514 TaxID=1121881 RepID=A0A1M4UG68_9ACTN|nr:cytochrome c biogenesis protein CcdA [Ferrithrix thermotolerans]SHE55782.1 cytochrome c-type biogenesis protein [Ferrithrix thermotolerans DSM 19514]
MVPGLEYVAAFGGGIVSFLSPCVLPLVPAYLSVVSGVGTQDIVTSSSDNIKKLALSTTLFILGFAIVFTALGLTVSAIGASINSYKPLLVRVSGVVLLLMAAFLLASVFLKLPWLYQEKRFHPQLSRFGLFASPIAGMAFAFGWTPCIGPILASVLAVAATSGKATQGAILLISYSLGLGVPFLVTGLAFSKLVGAFAFIKRHFTVLTSISAGVLALFGILLSLNDFSWITIHLENLATSIGLGSLNKLG